MVAPPNSPGWVVGLIELRSLRSGRLYPVVSVVIDGDCQISAGQGQIDIRCMTRTRETAWVSTRRYIKNTHGAPEPGRIRCCWDGSVTAVK